MPSINQPISRYWFTDDRTYKFDFEIILIDNHLPVVKAKLLFTAPNSSPYNALIWESDNLPYKKLFLDGLKSFDGYQFEGSILLSIKRNNKGMQDLVLWAEVKYGTNRQFKNFNGPLLVQSLTVEPNVLPEPVIIPDVPDTEVVSSNASILPDDYDDLFPYTYLRSWPTPDKEILKYSFFDYTPQQTSPPSDTFYDQLKDYSMSNDRMGIETAAQLFLERRGEGDSLLIWPDELKGPIAKFGMALDEIDRLCIDEQVRVEEIITANTGRNFSGSGNDSMSHYLDSSEYVMQRQQLWQTYFALIIKMGFQFQQLEQITRILVADNLVHLLVSAHLAEEVLTPDQIRLLCAATIILPESIFPLPKYQLVAPAADNNWLEPYAIGDLHLVQQKLMRYESGEVATIVNVMQGEKKEVIHRNLKSTQAVELEDHAQHRNDGNSTGEGSISLENEVWNTLADTKEVYSYDQLDNTYSPPTSLIVNGSWQKSAHTTAPGNKKLSEFAKQILSDASKKIATKVSRYRSSTALNETEETTKSIYDNIEGTSAKVGVYKWLNKIYKAKVVSYGEHLILTFLINKPAENFIRKTFNFQGRALSEPMTLSEKGIQTFSQITRANFSELLAYYEVTEVILPPQETIPVSETLVGAQNKLISIPPGYEATKAYITYFAAANENSTSQLLIGRETFPLGNSTPSSVKLNSEQQVVPSALVMNDLLSSPPELPSEPRVLVEITCQCTEQQLEEWKVKVYEALVEGYNKRKNLYYQQFSQENSKGWSNAQKNRSIIREELKMASISEVYQGYVQDQGRLKQSMSPPVDVVNEPRYIEFISNAFEWGEMTYFFEEAFGGSAIPSSVFPMDDQVFVAFLQASSARVIIPVKRSLSHGLLYLLKTGTIWVGEDQLVPALQGQEGIVLQLKEALDAPEDRRTIIEEWEVSIPTMLQILEEDQSWMYQDSDIC